MTHVTSLPDDGYIRIPRSYMSLDISPGAKTLIIHLCASANTSGESWHSYENIGKMMGRSKASISNYVDELVRIGIVKAIEQRMANGYNYRRRLRLTEWPGYIAKWRQMTQKKKSIEIKEQQVDAEVKVEVSSVTQALSNERKNTSSPTPQPSPGADPAASIVKPIERSVQPAECKDPTGPNKININNTHGARAPVVWTSIDEQEWRKFRPSDKDQISVAHGKPSSRLIEKLQQLEVDLLAASEILPPAEASQGAQRLLEGFAATRGLKADSQALREATKRLASIARTPTAQQAALTALSNVWKPHWRLLPTPLQIQKTTEKAVKAASPSADTLIQMSKVKNRLWIASFHLERSKDRQSGSAACDEQVGPLPSRHLRVVG